MIMYNSDHQRADMRFARKKDHTAVLMVCFAPGYPAEDIEDCWQNVPPLVEK